MIGVLNVLVAQVSTHFFDHTALKPKVRLETMAEMKPVQLNVRSEADASATPACNRVEGEGPF